jgi:hypothetical protein
VTGLRRAASELGVFALMAGSGPVLVLVGWLHARTAEDAVHGMPLLVSAGLGGLGLTLVGSYLLCVQLSRRHAARTLDVLDELQRQALLTLEAVRQS